MSKRNSKAVKKSAKRRRTSRERLWERVVGIALGAVTAEHREIPEAAELDAIPRDGYGRIMCTDYRYGERYITACIGTERLFVASGDYEMRNAFVGKRSMRHWFGGA